MKTYLLTIMLLFLFVRIGLAQNTNLEYKSALKLYNLTTYEEEFNLVDDTTSTSHYYTTKRLQILHPTIAFQWKTDKNNFHEIELTGLMRGKLSTQEVATNDSTGNSQTMSGSDIISTQISARYEFILNFNKTKDKKLVPSLGFGFNPYYRQMNNTPKIQSEFPTTESRSGMRVFITPRINYFVTSKLFIDINIPLCFFDTYYNRDNIIDPTIPEEERTISTFNFNQFPKVFSGRIGIGVKL